MEQARFTFWRNKKQWTFHELAHLLLGLEPFTPSDIIGHIDLEQESEGHEVWQLRRDLVDLANADPEFSELLEEEKLSIYSDDQFDSVFLLNWISNLEGLEVPPELQPLLNQIHKKTGFHYWVYQHDTKLLEKCRWVIEHYWEGKDIKKVPSKAVIVNQLTRKHGLSGREAAAVDLVTRHDQIRNRKK
jgi:hypothetical protein